MKVKDVIACFLLFLVASTVSAQSSEKPKVVWDEVVSGYGIHSRTIRIDNVRLYGDRTEVGIHISYQPGYWIKINSNTYLQADGATYALKNATVVTLDKEFWMPASGEVDFVLTFEPVPVDCKQMDFIEPNGWKIMNVRSASVLPHGIVDTYWCNEATGDWFIGFTPEHVIYANKVWNIISQTEKKDAYELMIGDESITLPIKVSKMKKGVRSIEVAGLNPVACSPITTAAMPEYPTKDMESGFKDNGYREGDYVTIIGWLKDMPEEMWQLDNKFELAMNNFLIEEEEDFIADLDSLGRFTLKAPILNTSEVFLDWARSGVNSVLEPGETYFFLNDFATGQKLFMGKNVRLQNEILAHPIERSRADLTPEGRGKADATKVWAKADSIRAVQMEGLKQLQTMYPNLSQRYIDYAEGLYRNSQACNMMQARFNFPNFDVPQDYLEYVGKEFWQNRPQPYTLHRDFSLFMDDYLDQLSDFEGRISTEDIAGIILEKGRRGKITLTDKEKEALKQLPALQKEFIEKINNAPEEEKQALADVYNNNELTKTFNDLLQRYNSEINNELSFSMIRPTIAAIDSVGCEKLLREFLIARELYKTIDNVRRPMPDSMVEFVENEVKHPLAKRTIMELHDKYLSLQKRNTPKTANLQSADVVKDMSDGEKILRKLIEPYKGKIILLDIWGTWCGPCKEALSHSQEEYARLAPYDMVFLYLANRSSEESWKNVIAEYEVVGDNVVHYNLPHEQQQAVERFLKVNSFPTYKLIDAFGNILPVNADPRNLDKMEELVKMISQ